VEANEGLVHYTSHYSAVIGFSARGSGYHCHRRPNVSKHYSSKEEILQSFSTLEKEAAPAQKHDNNSDPGPSSEYRWKVVGITNGDTLTLLVDQMQIKIRLSQINIQESGQPYGSKAKQVLSDLDFGKEARARLEEIEVGETSWYPLIIAVDEKYQVNNKKV